MSDAGYEWYLELKRNYARNRDDDIKQVNACTNIPQNILLAKTVSDTMVTDTAKTMKCGDDFVFTEAMVNKLMYFAFLQGSRDINEKSYSAGWQDCLTDIRTAIMPVANKLNLYTESEINND